MALKSKALSLKRKLNSLCNNKASQVSVEYLTIMGFVALVTVPLLVIYFNSVQSTGDEISGRQALQIARKIADASESVFFLGEPSQATIKAFIPKNIVSAVVNNTYIIFTIKTKDGISDIVQLSSVNMTGTLPTSPGIYSIKVKSESNRVVISYS